QLQISRRQIERQARMILGPRDQTRSAQLRGTATALEVLDLHLAGIEVQRPVEVGNGEGAIDGPDGSLVKVDLEFVGDVFVSARFPTRGPAAGLSSARGS